MVRWWSGGGQRPPARRAARKQTDLLRFPLNQLPPPKKLSSSNVGPPPPQTRQPNQHHDDINLDLAADIISAVEFDADGSYLATGDRGGRVVLFERVPAAGPAAAQQQRFADAHPDARALPPAHPRGPGFEYRYLTEFQSHEPEFDYLKSLEIEEKINKLRWVHSPKAGGGGGGGGGGGNGGSKHLLSTNDKTLKLWRVYERRHPTHVVDFNVERGAAGGGGGQQQQQQQQNHHPPPNQQQQQQTTGLPAAAAAAAVAAFGACSSNGGNNLSPFLLTTAAGGGGPAAAAAQAAAIAAAAQGGASPQQHALLLSMAAAGGGGGGGSAACDAAGISLFDPAAQGAAAAAAAVAAAGGACPGAGPAAAAAAAAIAASGGVGGGAVLGLSGGLASAAQAAAAGLRLALPGALRLPRVAASDVVLASRPRRVYANAHAYHVNSVSVASDQETFLSADDLRVHLWHLDVAHTAFNVVDIKPPSMEDLTEVITSAEFHPRHCHLFAYSSSKGCIRLADLRQAALCDRAAARAFEEDGGGNGNGGNNGGSGGANSGNGGGAKSFFSEIIASVSDVRFSRDGRLLLSRDYMSLKLWDLAMERRPVAVFPVHEHLRARLCDLYENDCIFDKFDACMDGTATRVASGSYNNCFRVFGTGGDPDGEGQQGVTLEASRDPARRRLAAARAAAAAQAAAAARGNRFALRRMGAGLGGGASQGGSPGASGGGRGTSGSGRPGELAGGGGGSSGGGGGSGKDAAAAAAAAAAGAAVPDPALGSDYASKLLHLAWHPEANVIACAAANSLYMYCAAD